MAELRGVLNALLTPFTSDGEVVEERLLRALVDHSIRGGIHGLVPCGSTGEFTSLSLDERKLVLEIVLDETAGRVPVVAHTGAMTTREAVSLSRHAERAGASAVMLVAPYYEPLTLNEVSRYYKDVAASVGISVMVYNLPAATGVNLNPEEIAKLAALVPNIRYVKDTSGDMSQAARLIHEYGDVISTFVGHDTLYLASIVEGASGSVLGTGNLLPSELAAIWDALQAQELERARAMWAEIFPLMRFLVSGSYVAGLKSGLEILGFPIGVPRAPLEALGERQLSDLKTILSALPSPLSLYATEPT
jgi:4-hydroxy-tetrahydrodipicolinate synthase